MGITIKRTGKLTISAPQRLAKEIAALVLGEIIDRTAKGIDMNGKAFKQYSEEYKKARNADGRSTDVQLILSGGMIRGTRIQGIEQLSGTKARARIAPSASASRYVSLDMFGIDARRGAYNKQVKDFNKALDRKKNPYFGPRQYPKKTPTNPPQNVVGYWLHHGTKTMPARPWLGVSKEFIQKLKAHIRNVIARG